MFLTVAVFPTIKHSVPPKKGEIAIVRVSDLSHTQPLQPIKPIETEQLPVAAEVIAPEPAQAPQPVSQPASTYSSQNLYTWGNCTYGVASWINVPQDLGNANQWAYNASREGFTVSPIPRVGSVAQTTGGYAGHVALVIGVDGDTVTIQEMNYAGLGVTSQRTAPINSFTYIYF